MVKYHIYFMVGKMNVVQKQINVIFLYNKKDGIRFPDNANENDKALLIMCAVFIDYLWFENF